MQVLCHIGSPLWHHINVFSYTNCHNIGVFSLFYSTCEVCEWNAYIVNSHNQSQHCLECTPIYRFR